ncbi:hypothetical protein AWB75_01985 [Caballeronia catudaia]|uniref:Uncharacterized protein n=1 Tax=Caballeronia catudaia TaxID=1777136 RepID=A0A158ABL3_9BURK|nr:hypothetical protein AWB75_01985 [Caballeronia catudaia]
MESCFRVGLLALPLPGAGVTFFAAAKKVTKESSFSQPKHFTPAAAQAIGGMAPRVASVLIGLIGRGPRTVCHPITLSVPVQHEIAPAQRYALPLGMQWKPTNRQCSERERIVNNEEARADPIDRSAAKRAGAIWCCTSKLCSATSQTVRDPRPVRPSRALATPGAIQPIACAAAGVRCLGWG